MRWAILLFCYVFVAFTFAGTTTALFAADLKSPPQEDAGRSSSDDRQYFDEGPTDEEVAEFCYGQRQICRKVCNLRYRDDNGGCSQKCERRLARCNRTGCYRWEEPDFLIAEKFGGIRCDL